MERSVRLDTVSSRVSTLGLAGFLANEARVNSHYGKLSWKQRLRLLNVFSAKAEFFAERDALKFQGDCIEVLSRLVGLDQNELKVWQGSLGFAYHSMSDLPIPLSMRNWLQQSC